MSDAADEAPLGNHKHLKGLESLIGTWSGESFTLERDRPTAGLKKGEELTFSVTWKWEVFGSAISVHTAVGPPDADPIWKNIWLVGWDTANERIICTGFEATGGHARADDWEIQPDKVTFKGKGSLPAGNKTSWTMIYSDITKVSCTYQLIDMLVDVMEQPGHHAKVTMKRVEGK